MNGAKIVLACLREQKVDTVFGYPGGAVIPLYDALYDEEEIYHIRTAHEQGAVHAADGYARSTGKVGVCIATSGPGATNTVTGIATAYMDSVPMVIITGQVPTSLLGRDSFQEIDITGVTLSVTKHNYLVRSINVLADTLREAFEVARSGRPGPVLVDIPKDIFLTEYDYDKAEITDNNDLEDIYVGKNDLPRVIELINNSKKPIIYGGGGIKISNACEELRKFAEKGDIPVVSTLMGLGSINRNHPLSLGLVGMHGFRENNLGVTNSDLIIAVGARFSDRVIGHAQGFAPKAKIIHIDIDATEMNKNINTEIFVLGDLKKILNTLIEKINPKDNSSWKEEIEGYKSLKEENNLQFTPKNILSIFNESMEEDTFVVTDVGQHQMWSAQYWKFISERSFVSSGGLGTMGFGLGAAIGAKMGNFNNSVLLVTGDGSFRMNCNELVTIARYSIPITILLLNNQCLGMVRQWQKMFSGRRYSQTDIDDCVDYVKLVNAYGIEGFKVNNLDDLRQTLENKDFKDKPLFIECVIDKDDCVFPIVPPGKAIDNLIEIFD